MGERQFGPYRLVRQIAVGGMAEIHLAKTKGIAGFEKYVALKMIHPNYAEDDQFIGMLVDEAKIAVQLNHGNIAQTFDLGRVGDTFYITMEYVDGADLYKILRRGSENDFEMPLDVCAFIAKDIASALDHAHRKRDHQGKSLGIVHRDVSPQNVLISYSGEVKLVDFGIAKATMKARQTAVGVIKGKYYYMSPEQAWGDQIDYRSDIFSAGIVLYEMITGQMMYLEEDLNRLLDMVRKADIAPPSTLRRGVPPQLEKIVMHALAKDRRDRYQSASDFATDLERFLHAYSPVFTAAKVANMIKTVIGNPMEVPDAADEVEHRDGPMSTHTLSSEDLIVDKDELQQDENSVIFRVADLKPKTPTEAPRQKPPTGGSPTARPKQPTGAQPVAAARPKQPTGAQPVAAQRSKQPTGVPAGPRVTRQADISEPGRPKSITAIPSIPKMQPASQPAAKPQPKPQPAPAKKPPSKRDMNEVTRQVEPIRGGTTEDSGLLGIESRGPSRSGWQKQDGQGTLPGLEDGEGSVGESTMISAPGQFGSFMDHGNEDSIDATQVSSIPTAPNLDDTNPNLDNFDGGGTFAGETHNDPVVHAATKRDDDTQDTNAGDADGGDDGDSEDGPTLQRDFRESAKPRKPAGRGSSPPALAAKIHAPAVSELRKPRASRKTPAGGNVLQQIVGSKPNEAMPTPRPGALTRNDDSGAMTMPGAPSPNDGLGSSTILGQNNPLPGPANAPRPRAGTANPTGPQPRAGASGNMPQQRPGGSQQMPQQPAQYSGYAADASGLPMQTPQGGNPIPNTPGSGGWPAQQGAPGSGGWPAQQGAPGSGGYPAQQGYPGSGGWPAGAAPGQPGYPGFPPHQSGQMPVSPGALYQLQPHGAPPPQPMTLTGQLRLFEADELGDKYKLSSGPPKWLKVAVISVIAIAVAAGLTFFIMKATRDSAPTTGSVRIESVPPGAEVTFDGTRMAGATPLTIDSVPTGTRHDVRVELGRHKPYTETVDIPRKGGEVGVKAMLEPISGKLTVLTTPDGAEIRIDGVLRGRAPTTIGDIEMSSAKKLELRLNGYEPVIVDLTWPANGTISINQKLVLVR